jgi:hypothetical protein
MGSLKKPKKFKISFPLPGWGEGRERRILTCAESPSPQSSLIDGEEN